MGSAELGLVRVITDDLAIREKALRQYGVVRLGDDSPIHLLQCKIN